MANYKLMDFNIPFGLCEITYGDIILPSMGSEGFFQAIPKYQKIIGGKFNNTKGYLFEQYDVSFEVSFEQESIELLQLYMPSLQSDGNGLYDSPGKVNMDTKKLVIHPYSVIGKETDICIWNAIIDPETGFQKVYGKETNKYKVKFIGNPVKNHSDANIVNSYFYIGDWSKVGVTNA
jgi:hypothetical protein